MVIAVLVLWKTAPTWKKESGVVGQGVVKYSETDTLETLVARDTDEDGVADWKEVIYGLDPAKKETTAGTPDSVAMEKLTIAQTETAGTKDETSAGGENLTQTDKFSRELFETIAALSQSGALTQETIDGLSSTLIEEIKDPPAEKIFYSSDLKASKDESKQAFKNYSSTLDALVVKNYQLGYSVLDVLYEFSKDENNPNMSALSKLDTVIEQTKKLISGMLKMSVPESIAILHLNVINNLQRLIENTEDIKLFEVDIIASLGGISKYGENAAQLEIHTTNLINAVNQKLNN